MAEPDEDDDAQVEQTDDEDREPGSEGDGAGGEDSPSEQHADGDVPAQRPGAGDDEGASPARTTAQPDAQQRGSRFQRLANENREYRERLERLERERENERQQWLRQQQQATEQQERDRMALMTPEERAEYRITQTRSEIQRDLQNIRLQNMMELDKATYTAKASSNPLYARMQAQVEEMFQDLARKGQPTDRETILFHLLGKQAVNGASSSKPRQQARRRVENQRVNPSSGKSDTERRTGSSGRVSTAEERLKDVLI